ncbi:MAG TPA: methyl-accepting chemotaxis protein, partial [Stellaceae bacterium]|nr:methyl-accepting chemotaxis protein [Stellaceae bacterium]
MFSAIKTALLAAKQATERFGIGGKLLLAFGTVASLTVLASVVGYLSYNRVGVTLDGIAGEHIPAMSLSLRLAKSSAEIVSAAPSLLAATDAKEREAAVGALQTYQRDLSSAIDALAAMPGGAEATASLRRAASEISKNLAEIATTIEKRLALRDQRIDAATRLRATHGALAAALAPLVDDASFDLVTGLETAADGGDADALKKRLSELGDQQLTALQAMFDLRADGNLAFGLLSEAANTPGKELLPPIRDRFNAAAGHLEKSLAALKNEKTSGALRDPVTKLIQFGRGDKSIFELRSQELDALTAAELGLFVNRKLASTLEQEVTKLVDRSQSAAQSAATDTATLLAHGRVLLISIAAASLLIALVIGGLYVGRNVIRRLISLRHSMTELASGDLDVAIEQSGRDEIADMAAALAVFRDNARAAKQASAERAAERQRMAEKSRADLLALADGFEQSVKSVVVSVSGAASQMQDTAKHLVSTAEETSRLAEAVSEASNQASSNVQTVASAADELSNSTSEIGRQVSESAKVASRAVAETQRTNGTVQGLAAAAQKIGDVVKLINDIASQTNLLALNATIEAARAG